MKPWVRVLVVLMVIPWILTTLACGPGPSSGGDSDSAPSPSTEGRSPASIVIETGPVEDNTDVDGTTSQILNAIVKDIYGNPVADGTPIFWGIVDNPPSGYKQNGTDGASTAGSAVFTSAAATFLTNNVEAGDTLIILEGEDEGGYSILSVDSETQVTLTTALSSTASNLDFVAGNAHYARICGTETSDPTETGNPIPTDLCLTGDSGAQKGVAHTRTVYGETAVHKTYYVFAATTDRTIADARQLTYPAVDGITISVTLDTSEISDGAAASVNATIHVQDQANNPNDISGASVTVSSSSSLVTVATSPVTTGDNGYASTSLNYSGADVTEDTSVTITATYSGASGTATLTIKDD